MIKYLRHSEINFQLWDNCIKNSTNECIYAYSWYLNIVAKEWDALVEDDYVSVFPLPFRKKNGFKYIYQPPFTQQLGLFSVSKNNLSRLNDFILAIPKEYCLVEININKQNIGCDKKEFSFVENSNFELNISENADEIKSNYSKNLKRNLKKADNNNLIISDNIDPKLLVELFKKNRGDKLNAYSEEDYQKLISLIYKMLEKNIAKVSGVFSPENNLIAAALFVFNNNKIIFLFSGLNEQGKLLNAMPFLINKIIESNCEANKTFDFEGSNDKNLARFYKSFGSQEFKYQGLRYYRFPFLLKVLFNVINKIKQRK